MSKIEIIDWTEKGALSVLALVPRPGGDWVFAPDDKTVQCAIEFLDGKLKIDKKETGVEIKSGPSS